MVKMRPSAKGCALMELSMASSRTQLRRRLKGLYRDLRGARDAMTRGVVPLMRRLKGLEGTPYARSFLLGTIRCASIATMVRRTARWRTAA